MVDDRTVRVFHQMRDLCRYLARQHQTIASHPGDIFSRANLERRMLVGGNADVFLGDYRNDLVAVTRVLLRYEFSRSIAGGVVGYQDFDVR